MRAIGSILAAAYRAKSRETVLSVTGFSTFRPHSEKTTSQDLCRAGTLAQAKCHLHMDDHGNGRAIGGVSGFE
jgi:hypothetical protein